MDRVLPLVVACPAAGWLHDPDPRTGYDGSPLVERGTGRLQRYADTGGPTYGLELAAVIEWARRRLARASSG